MTLVTGLVPVGDPEAKSIVLFIVREMSPVRPEPFKPGQLLHLSLGRLKRPTPGPKAKTRVRKVKQPVHKI